MIQAAGKTGALRAVPDPAVDPGILRLIELGHQQRGVGNHHPDGHFRQRHHILLPEDLARDKDERNVKKIAAHSIQRDDGVAVSQQQRIGK